MIKDKPGKVQNDDFFLCDGENLALHLVNTEMMKRGKPFDLFTTPQDIAEWWQGQRLSHPAFDEVSRGHEDPTLYDEELLKSVKTLRSALRAIFSALVVEDRPEQKDVNVLNAILSLGYSSLELTQEGDLWPVWHTTDTRHGTLLLPIALSAMRLITQGERTRLHLCENERCILFFYDTTKSSTRRWCSTGCMDRARSIQRYREAKQSV